MTCSIQISLVIVIEKEGGRGRGVTVTTPVFVTSVLETLTSLLSVVDLVLIPFSLTPPPPPRIPEENADGTCVVDR